MNGGSTGGRLKRVAPVSISFAGGAVLFGLLQLLTQQLSVFDLRTEISALISAIVGALGIFGSAVKARSAARQNAREIEDELAAALAIFPPRAVKDVDIFDLGVALTAATGSTYVPRTHDPEIARALREDGGVIVSGPSWSGKTRGAVEAIRAQFSDGTLLVPEDGDGLTQLLRRHSDKLPFPVSSPCVLWLDDLDRFLGSIDLNALDVWIWPPEGGEQGALRLVATIRDSVLADLLTANTNEGWRLRRILARTAGVPCSDQLDGREQQAMRDARYAVDGPALEDAVSKPPAGSWQPQITGAPPRERRRRSIHLDVPVVIIAAIVVALGILLAWRVRKDGWSVPPTLSAQFTKLAGETPTCAVHDVYPDPAHVGMQPQDSLRFVTLAQQCAGSDQVSFYRVASSGRILRVATDAPVDTTRPWHFQCLGEGTDPCPVPISAQGSAVATVGAWTDPDSLRPLAVAYSFDGGKVTRTPLPIPGTFAASTGSRAAPPSRAQTLPMQRGLAATAPLDPPSACRKAPLGSLCSPATDALAAVADDPGAHPSLLIAARGIEGSSVFSLTQMTTRAWRLSVGRARGGVSVAARSCLLFKNGVALSTVVNVGAGKTPAAALRELWEEADGRQAIC
jgi:hypothetical protein